MSASDITWFKQNPNKICSSGLRFLCWYDWALPLLQENAYNISLEGWYLLCKHKWALPLLQANPDKIQSDRWTTLCKHEWALPLLQANPDKIPVAEWTELFSQEWALPLLRENPDKISAAMWSELCKHEWARPLFFDHPDKIPSDTWAYLCERDWTLPLLSENLDKLAKFQVKNCGWVLAHVMTEQKKSSVSDDLIKSIKDEVRAEVLAEVETKYMARLDTIEDKLNSLTSEHEKFATLFKNEFAATLAAELEKVNTGRDETLTEEIDSLLVRMQAMEMAVSSTAVSTQNSISELEAMVAAMSDKVDSLAPLPAAKSVDEMIAEAVEMVASAVEDADFSRDECRKWFECKATRGRVPDDALIQAYLFAEWEVEWSRDSLVAVGDALMSESVAKSA